MDQAQEDKDFLDSELSRAKGSKEGLELIAARARHCRRCGLHRVRNRTVPGEGSADAWLMIVGEGSGRDEDAAGRPFVGLAGKALDSMLKVLAMPRSLVFITNIVKCRPATAVGGRWQNRPPKRIEASACRSYLMHQMEIIRPKIILCLGVSAARSLIEPRFDMSAGHGCWFKGPYGAEVTATFHPAYLRRGGAGMPPKQIEKLVTNDLKLINKRL